MTVVEPKDLPFDITRPIADLSNVEIAGQLDQVSGWMAAERQREHEAKQTYETVSKDVEAKIRAIRGYAERLMEQHKRRMSAFDGMLSKVATSGSAPRNTLARTATFAKPAATNSGGGPKNLAEAIISIWTLDQYAEPMTTEEIAEALAEVGYESDAEPSSLRSSINQSIAKLCKVGRMVKFRADGTQISPKDNSSRARKYLAAIRLPEPV
jgi:hypothetical protein